MRLPRPRRYHPGARHYDTLSWESVLYRAARTETIGRLGLRRGDRVLDVGCGTGLNHALLRDAVGPEGGVVGVDASPAMLRQARERGRAGGWTNVELIEGDAGGLTGLVNGPFDAVLFTYSLSVIGDWEAAWEQALSLLRPGGGVGVADTAYPRGRWRLLAPVAAAAFATGGVHPSRRVWDLVARDTDAATGAVVCGGHVHLAAGRRRMAGGTT